MSSSRSMLVQLSCYLFLLSAGGRRRCGSGLPISACHISSSTVVLTLKVPQGDNLGNAKIFWKIPSANLNDVNPVECGMKSLIHSQTSTVAGIIEVWEWTNNLGDGLVYWCIYMSLGLSELKINDILILQYYVIIRPWLSPPFWPSTSNHLI